MQDRLAGQRLDQIGGAAFPFAAFLLIVSLLRRKLPMGFQAPGGVAWASISLRTADSASLS